jgi:magnesium chelatase subunit I
MSANFPFSAIVGQDEMKRALLLAAVDPGIGGVLLLGDRGTGKSTAIRGLAALLPRMNAISGCRYNCAPGTDQSGCVPGCTVHEKGQAAIVELAVPVVDLPLGATEDRIVGALDIERALTRGEKSFEPGLLARANRGFLYIDEVNLLEDHLVDLLLDVAASGENIVEREAISVRHPARFVLIGSGNPEEGELRPQLLDRFGISVEVTTTRDVQTRVHAIRNRDAFERDPVGFVERHRDAERKQRLAIGSARELLPALEPDDRVLTKAAELCVSLGTDGLRGELALTKAARALAALEGARAIEIDHLRRAAGMALRHRLRRDPLDETGSAVRIERAVSEVLG